MQIVWVLEQPRRSFFEVFPRFRQIFRAMRVFSLDTREIHDVFSEDIFFNTLQRYLAPLLSKVHYVDWWMIHYGSCTPKRHRGYSNSSKICELDRGTLKGWKRNEKTASTKRTTDAKGRARWHGNHNLKGTGHGAESLSHTAGGHCCRCDVFSMSGLIASKNLPKSIWGKDCFDDRIFTCWQDSLPGDLRRQCDGDFQLH
ncbi:unnamed protein product [Symbiodinium natans]|uniref:Uncharacterized protein n=1 Tax=Symbiodinium natans TaxID=878477 RepID=A0A812M3L2_9DINO|nr:unnamed protein product [Symbiodinium natans]